MKWFSFFRALVYLKRISLSLETLVWIEEQRFRLDNPRYRSKIKLPAKKQESEIHYATVKDFNERYREDHEIEASLRDLNGE